MPDAPEGQRWADLSLVQEVRDRVESYAEQQLPSTAKLRQDGLAGLNGALTSVPDGMASGLLAGVNPVYGLYACMVGPIAGGLASSTSLMLITTTSASALAAGQALAGLPFESRTEGLFLLVVLIGAFQILFGLLGMGRLTRFVSQSVMTGFVIGIAVLTILSQLPTVTGYEPTGGSRIAQTFNLVVNLGQVDLSSLATAVLALVLAVWLPRTSLGNFGSLAAIAVPSLLVALPWLDGVEVVQDVGEIPSGVPLPALPSLSALSPDVVTGAFAVAVIILVQGAGVSRSVPNPDGSRSSISRDFIAQGVANAVSGLFRGLPVGASLSTTALSVLSGARTRWSAIFAGLWMAAIVIAFPWLVSHIAMPALGALLIVASVSTIKPVEVSTIWEAGWPARLAIATTFLATLNLPIQAAVGIGVALSALLYVYGASTDVSLVEVVERADGRLEERPPPTRLPSNTVTVLQVYGHLFFAGARSFERLLPRPEEARNPVVILRLRGRSSVGATLVDVLSNYAEKLRQVNGRLYLTGISEGVYEQVARTGKLRLTGPVQAYERTPIVGQSTREAYADARTWLVNLNVDVSPDEETSGRVSS